jgi:hypothetical protein
VSLTASLIILRPTVTGMGLVLFELAWAGTLWAVMAAIAVAARRRGAWSPAFKGERLPST